jgi:hypothetical protein
MTNTILLITRDRLTRADFRSGREPRRLELTQDFAPPVDDFPSLVEAALRLSKRRPGRVWVLSTEVWTQTLALTSESVAGLGQTELAKALAFEAEPFSGVSGLESVCQCVELTGRRNERMFWLVLLPSGQLEQVDYVVQAAGGVWQALGTRAVCRARCPRMRHPPQSGKRPASDPGPGWNCGRGRLSACEATAPARRPCA